ncbi:rRNA-processing protein las1 [Coemansia sp. RSA 552]|nr:rRNA-processing protein las1 [Coemansia sp. RSA 552]
MAAVQRVPKVVPWTSSEEYAAVSECLYSADLGEQRRGVAIVKAWRARGRVPAAIDATANLVEVAVADRERRPGMAVNQLRHMYSMALVRFVNSIVDLEQRGNFAQSMVVLASRIGMPAWFVELRHACTHEQIPSLAVLRSAGDQAHQWLGDYYWKRQSRTLPEDTLLQVREAISAYASTHEKLGVSSSKSRLAAMDSEDADAFRAAKASIARLLTKLHSDAVRLYIVPVLLEPGFLVPEDKRQRAKFPDCRMPPLLAKRWGGLLRLVADAWGTAFVYEELLAGIAAGLMPDASTSAIFDADDSAPGMSQAATLVAWVRWILERFYAADPMNEAPQISIDGLLESCLRSPGYYSRSVLKVVSGVDPVLKRELRPFVDFMGKALAALVAVDAEAKPGAKAPASSEKALDEEESLMQRRLEELLGARPANEPAGADEQMEIDPADARPAPADRWSYAAQAPCPIGTLSDGSVPALAWPDWIDSIPLGQRSEGPDPAISIC